MSKLEREGIFKARPFRWDVLRAASGAIAISFGFEILAQYDRNGGWVDWSEAGAFRCFGDWWVVKKDGEIHSQHVDQLVRSLGWSGSLEHVSSTVCPDTVVQITVAAETFKENTRYRASWMNPEFYAPGSIGATVEEAQQMDARFGSLLRAEAAAAKAKIAASSNEDDQPAPPTDSDIPF